MNSLRLPSDVAPVFLACVLINLDERAATIQRVAASALGARKPIIISRLYAVIVRLETATLEALERLAAVIECAPSLGKRYTPNPRCSREFASLALDIHDATRLCCCLPSRGLSKAA